MRTHVRRCLQVFSASIFLFALGCGRTSVSTAAPVSTHAATLTSLSVSPANQTMAQGSTAQFTATGTYSDSTTADLTTQAAWTVSSSTASVNQLGVLQALAVGSVSLTATSGAVAASVALTITPPVVIVAAPASFSTSIAPAAGDDLAGPCAYDLQLLDTTNPVLGVWVIFERTDSAALWEDAGLRALAARRRQALVYAHQCNAASYNDLQSDGRKGPGVALAAALDSFANLSNHAEVRSTPISLFGFSAAGVLSLTVAEMMPERMATVVTYAAGSAPLGVNQLTPTAAMLGIPMLMLVNADDNLTGTYGSEAYFRSGLAAGGPWAFAAQPNVSHCCTITTAPILLAWMDAVLNLRTGASTPAPIDRTTGWTATYACTNSGVVDSAGTPDCLIATASIREGVALTSRGTAWMPDATTANAWLAWVGKP